MVRLNDFNKDVSVSRVKIAVVVICKYIKEEDAFIRFSKYGTMQKVRFRKRTFHLDQLSWTTEHYCLA